MWDIPWYHVEPDAGRQTVAFGERVAYAHLGTLLHERFKSRVDKIATIEDS